MADLLGNAASGQLLALLAIPITGAVLFAAVIAIFLSRRRKKSQMKLGTQPKKSRDPAPAADLENSSPDMSILSSLFPDQESKAGSPVQETGSPGSSATTLHLSSQADRAFDNPGKKSGPPPSGAATSQRPEPEEEKIDLTTRLGQLAAAPPPSTKPVELLRLLRHPQSGQLIVEVAGQQYTRLIDIDEKKVGQYIFKLAANLLSFTNGMIATEAGLKSIYNPRVEKTPKPIGSPSYSPVPPPSVSPESEPSPIPESKPDPESPSDEAEAALLASLKAQPPPPEQSPRRGGLFKPARSGPEPILLPSLNLAGEINKIAQARLSASPLAQTTELDITSDPGGGIRIRVNDQIFSGPDEIPDPEIKKLIKASIKQWERS